MAKTNVSNNLKRFAKRLYANNEEGQGELINALVDPVEYPVAIVWTKGRVDGVFQTLERPQWFPDFADLVPFDQRPGQHELHQSGHYYCLDPSSIFMMLGVIRHVASIADASESVLDVCASPGGKSVIASCSLHPEFLYCNEVIGKRLGPLISNLKRCEIANTNVVSIDTSHFEDTISNVFDTVIVDAPCSGQSLVAKGKTSPGCFHPATINMNANRQRRILSNAAKAVRPGGWLVYMTCTYSLKENESNVDWFLKRNSDFNAIEIESLREFKSHLGKAPGYRLWPESGIGAGGFFAVFRKTDSNSEQVPHGEGDLSNLRVRWSSSGVDESSRQ